MNSLLVLVENSLAEDLKTTTLVAAITRNAIHVVTSIAALVSYLDFKYPCVFGKECPMIDDDHATSGMLTVFINYYFLADILSLPQDIYYTWAATSPKFDPSDKFTEDLSDGLTYGNIAIMAFAQLLAIWVGLTKSVSLDDFLMNGLPNVGLYTLLLLPGYISMIGAITFSYYIDKAASI